MSRRDSDGVCENIVSLLEEEGIKKAKSSRTALRAARWRVIRGDTFFYAEAVRQQHLSSSARSDTVVIRAWVRHLI